MGIGRPPVVTNDAEARLQAVAAEVESSLSALEAYRDALADPHTNLRAVAPLLTALEAAGRRLDETLTDLPADAPLRQVGAQTSALIATEKGRFESGAYN
jgi:hypothetical protein